MMRAEADQKLGYAPKALDGWSECARVWAIGCEPQALPRVAEPAPVGAAEPRDVFIFMINGAKERAPAAAMALLQRLGFESAELP